MKQVLTVFGPVAPTSLGRTLTHEHFSLDFDHFYVPPPSQLETIISGKIKLENVGYVRQYPYASRYNIHFCDDDTHQAVAREILLYKKFGGGTIVENTSHGLNRNLQLCHDIARETGVNIIAGTGHYVAGVQASSCLAMTVEEMTELYAKEIQTGCDGDNGLGIRCGFIGEVGSGWPIHDFEKKSIQATAIVQEQLGCGVSFHPGRDSKAPFEIMRIYLEAGGRAEKCVMSHLDRTIFDDGDLLEFAGLGSFCQFDLFGTECSFYQLNPGTDMPSDGQRIDRLVRLIREGKTRILMSHDIHTKHRLTEFGGHGFSHILNNILPRFSSRLGDSAESVLHQITVDNPAEWLQFEM